MQDNNNIFVIECPNFAEITEARLEPAGTAALTVAKSSYAHPVDSAIIEFLDMPGVKTLFGSAVSMLSDLSYGQIISNGIPVNETNFPEINDMVDHCVAVMGIKKPYVVISSAVNLNAFTMGSDEEPFIVLGNMLVRVMDREKLMFVIGHECGHIAMGHVIYHTIVSAASQLSSAVPLIGPFLCRTSAFALMAWSRRSEITADRAGLLCCGDVEVAENALLQIEAGFIDSGKVDIQAYLEGSDKYRKRNVFRRVGEFAQAHPSLAKRLEAIRLFADSELYYQARGLQAPVGVAGEQALTHAVEKIVAVI